MSRNTSHIKSYQSKKVFSARCIQTTNGPKSQNGLEKLTGLNEPILVYFSNIVLVGTFEGPEFGLPKAMEDCIFPPLLQKLVEFL